MYRSIDGYTRPVWDKEVVKDYIDEKGIRQSVKNYSLPYFSMVYKAYFKDLAAYAVTLRQEIYRVRHCRDYNEVEKEFIVNKKIRPFLYKYKEDIEYGEGLLKRTREEILNGTISYK